MRRICLLLAAPAAAFAANAYAGPLEEAEQLLDQAAPMHCELLMTRYEVETLQPGSAAREELMSRLYKRAADLERDMAPAIQRFESARAILPPNERARLERHASVLLDECTRKASETYHFRLPTPRSAPAPVPRVAPYAPPAEKALQPSAQQGAIQSAPPQR